jgi:hypothetical protein
MSCTQAAYSVRMAAARRESELVDRRLELRPLGWLVRALLLLVRPFAIPVLEIHKGGRDVGWLVKVAPASEQQRVPLLAALVREVGDGMTVGGELVRCRRHALSVFMLVLVTDDQ